MKLYSFLILLVCFDISFGLRVYNSENLFPLKTKSLDYQTSLSIVNYQLGFTLDFYEYYSDQLNASRFDNNNITLIDRTSSLVNTNSKNNSYLSNSIPFYFEPSLQIFRTSKFSFSNSYNIGNDKFEVFYGYNSSNSYNCLVAINGSSIYQLLNSTDINSSLVNSTLLQSIQVNCSRSLDGKNTCPLTLLNGTVVERAFPNNTSYVALQNCQIPNTLEYKVIISNNKPISMDIYGVDSKNVSTKIRYNWYGFQWSGFDVYDKFQSNSYLSEIQVLPIKDLSIPTSKQNIPINSTDLPLNISLPFYSVNQSEKIEFSIHFNSTNGVYFIQKRNDILTITTPKNFYLVKNDGKLISVANLNQRNISNFAKNETISSIDELNITMIHLLLEIPKFNLSLLNSTVQLYNEIPCNLYKGSVLLDGQLRNLSMLVVSSLWAFPGKYFNTKSQRIPLSMSIDQDRFDILWYFSNGVIKNNDIKNIPSINNIYSALVVVTQGYNNRIYDYYEDSQTNLLRSLSDDMISNPVFRFYQHPVASLYQNGSYISNSIFKENLESISKKAMLTPSLLSGKLPSIDIVYKYLISDAFEGGEMLYLDDQFYKGYETQFWRYQFTNISNNKYNVTYQNLPLSRVVIDINLMDFKTYWFPTQVNITLSFRDSKMDYNETKYLSTLFEWYNIYNGVEHPTTDFAFLDVLTSKTDNVDLFSNDFSTLPANTSQSEMYNKSISIPSFYSSYIHIDNIANDSFIYQIFDVSQNKNYTHQVFYADEYFSDNKEITLIYCKPDNYSPVVKVMKGNEFKGSFSTLEFLVNFDHYYYGNSSLIQRVFNNIPVQGFLFRRFGKNYEILFKEKQVNNRISVVPLQFSSRNDDGSNVEIFQFIMYSEHIPDWEREECKVAASYQLKVSIIAIVIVLGVVFINIAMVILLCCISKSHFAKRLNTLNPSEVENLRILTEQDKVDPNTNDDQQKLSENSAILNGATNDHDKI
ncbi:hypothetical protein DLAC_03777 [Tieghemostelium lacteum]|uniref:Transmembrane protein n=1 Tax=Tieghemostelium lacteum TaxID=361077 RepID=A0A152A0S4_TIELA|nr:hypothetical protein DLAC_03777 [Tieghemostelium lacteum]|eukprot:KYQ99825.1 hypothetical protein DLAC_03777 [Tieghemostelium lacteum]